MEPKGTFLLPPQASTIAPEIDALYMFIFYLSVFFFIVITAGTLYFAVKYRKKEGESFSLTSGLRHNTKLEIIWSVIPTILFMIIFAWGWKVFLQAHAIPANAKTIHVQANQWAWNFQYSTLKGIGNSNDLYIPVNQPIKLSMYSKDVIHSLFIPDFRVKMDALPGRNTTLWFEATAVGEYDLYCTEYCGLDHSRMNRTVHVLSEEDYAAFLADVVQPRKFDEIYQASCRSCHSLDGSIGTGPTFKGLWGRTSEFTDGTSLTIVGDVGAKYIRDSVYNPNLQRVKGFSQAMPTHKNSITEEEIQHIVDGLKFLDQPGEQPPSEQGN
ncbi:MAG TPA: cytochrome c oxidase subunit II [Lentisphaeria bacterium]|nr:cytochrome c oxidase subunit II [Lentisphaeria bacterium]